MNKVFLGDDTKLVREYFASKVQEVEGLLPKLDDLSAKETLSHAEELYYLERYFEDIDFFSQGANYTYELNPLLAKAIKEKVPQIAKMQEMRAALMSSLKKKLTKPTALAIGENDYVYSEGKYYEKSELEDCFYEVDEKEIFLLLPDYVSKVADQKLAQKLQDCLSSARFVKNGKLDKFLKRFRSQKQSIGLDTLLEHFPFTEGEISPYVYQDKIDGFAREYLINESSSLESLKQLAKTSGVKDVNLRLWQIFKVLDRVIQFVYFMRSKAPGSRVYLLRDGLLMYEADYILSLLKEEACRAHALFFNRAMLTSKTGDNYFSWAVEILYRALETSQDFPDFQAAYQKLFDKEVRESTDLNGLVKSLCNYLMGIGIVDPNDSNQISFIDVGLRGSMPLFLQGMMRSDVSGRQRIPETSVYLYTLGPWFRKLYREKYFSNNYSFMRDLESLNTSEYLYKYADGSFNQGNVLVKMGPKGDQTLALIELIALTELSKYYQMN